MNRVNGFTLVELLVAMVAGSLLLGSLGWTIATLGRQLRVSQTDMQSDRLASVAPMLKTLLERLYPPRADGSGFAGDARRLVGITSPPMAAGPIGPMQLTLTVEPENGNDALYATLIPVSHAPAFATDAQKKRLLLSGYRQISFEYSTDPSSQGPVLPRMVTLVLTEPSGMQRRISAIPRITSDGTCRFDPISMSCRL